MTYREFRLIILELNQTKNENPKYFLWDERYECNEFDFTVRAINILEKILSNNSVKTQGILSFWFYELDCGKRWKESYRGIYPKTVFEVWKYYKEIRYA